MQLYITTPIPCSVFICDATTFVAGTDETVFRIDDAPHIITFLPAYSGNRSSCVYYPLTIKFNPFENQARKNFINKTLVEPYRIYDWGDGIFEIECAFEENHSNSTLRPVLFGDTILPYINNTKSIEVQSLPSKPVISNSNPSSLLASMEFSDKIGQQPVRKQKMELYSDGGLFLHVMDEQRPSETKRYRICEGKFNWLKGEMRLLDVGRERLLIVHVTTEKNEQLFALNNKFEVIAAIEGASCKIEEGYLTKIQNIDTVMGYERRTRYDFRNEKFQKMPDEIGFFTHELIRPTSDDEIALGLAEAVMFNREKELALLLSNELNFQLTLSDLRDFFGAFSECRIAPDRLGMNTKSVIVGVSNDESSTVRQLRKFFFKIEEAHIVDVTDEE